MPFARKKHRLWNDPRLLLLRAQSDNREERLAAVRALAKRHIWHGEYPLGLGRVGGRICTLWNDPRLPSLSPAWAQSENIEERLGAVIALGYRDMYGMVSTSFKTCWERGVGGASHTTGSFVQQLVKPVNFVHHSMNISFPYLINFLMISTLNHSTKCWRVSYVDSEGYWIITRPTCKKNRRQHVKGLIYHDSPRGDWLFLQPFVTTSVWTLKLLDGLW